VLQLAQVALELGDAPHDAPAVDLELGLAGATEPTADATALLRQVGLAPRRSRGSR
jgi:hypothetical protein